MIVKQYKTSFNKSSTIFNKDCYKNWWISES